MTPVGRHTKYLDNFCKHNAVDKGNNISIAQHVTGTTAADPHGKQCVASTLGERSLLYGAGFFGGHIKALGTLTFGFTVIHTHLIDEMSLITSP